MLSWKIGSNAACPPNPGSASERPSREWGLDKILQNRLGLWAVHKCAQRAVVRTNSRSRIWKGIHDKGMIMTQRGIKTKYKNQKKKSTSIQKGWSWWPWDCGRTGDFDGKLLLNFFFQLLPNRTAMPSPSSILFFFWWCLYSRDSWFIYMETPRIHQKRSLIELDHPTQDLLLSWSHPAQVESDIFVNGLNVLHPQTR